MALSLVHFLKPARQPARQADVHSVRFPDHGHSGGHGVWVCDLLASAAGTSSGVYSHVGALADHAARCDLVCVCGVGLAAAAGWGHRCRTLGPTGWWLRQ